MTRQTRLERNRLIQMTVDAMEEASPEKDLSLFFMDGETEAYFSECRGWTLNSIWKTKRKIRQLLIEAGIEIEEKPKGTAADG